MMDISKSIPLEEYRAIQCELERNREAIAELRSALKLALKALPFSTHPDAFEAVQIAEKLINTKETK